MKTITYATNEQWKSTMYWLLYTLIGGLVPTWGGAILLWIFGNWRGWEPFYANGEFILYSAALLAPALHILIKDARKPGFQLLAILNLAILFISFLLYAAIALSAFNIVNTEYKINLSLLSILSIWLFVLSVIISFLSELLENVKSDPDVEKIKSDQMYELSGEFKKLKSE
jgi:hypothetical protein